MVSIDQEEPAVTRFRTTPRRIATVTAMAAALATTGVAAPEAGAATTCKFANGVVEVHLTKHRDNVDFRLANGTIGIGGDDGTVLCNGGTPTTQNVDTVLVVDDSDNLATPASDDGSTTVGIRDPGSFQPGKTAEAPPGVSEIEFYVDTRNGQDSFYADDTFRLDIAVGNDGANWTFDQDADLIGMPFDIVDLYGRESSDFLSGQGGRGTGMPLTTAQAFKIDARRRLRPSRGQRHPRRRPPRGRRRQRHDHRLRRRRSARGPERGRRYTAAAPAPTPSSSTRPAA